jgi:16S rRNA (cytidine1402-2'-O)-methyltransferase
MTPTAPEPGPLYVVATPIGNLSDWSPRAAATLREATLIVCEDTRRTRVLLSQHGLRTPLLAMPAPREEALLDGILTRLLAGESIALVSDAGTPLVSDPGNRLVARCHASEVPVIPIPGPSAVTALLSACPLPTDRFQFVGFPPKKGRTRDDWESAITGYSGTSVFFVPGRDIDEVLRRLDARRAGGRVAIGRELTKLHEEIRVGDLATTRPGDARGELVVAARFDAGDAPTPELDPLRAHLDWLLERGVSRSEAVKALRALTGLPRKVLYDLAHEERP